MASEPIYQYDREIVAFKAEIRLRNVDIEVSRETIEDHLHADAFDGEDCVDFVRRNQNQIVENVASYLAEADDVSGIIVGSDQLKHCR